MNADGQTGPPDCDLTAEETVELTAVARRAGVKIVHARRYLEFGLFELAHPLVIRGRTPGRGGRNPTLRSEQRRAGGASGAATP